MQFLKEYTAPGKVYYVYFYDEKHYLQFNEVYREQISKDGPKLIRCIKMVNTIKDREEQLMFIKHHHEGKTNHRGITETLERLKINYYWRNMKTSISNFINNCEICQRTKYGRKTPYTPLMLTQTPSGPFEIVHMDIFTYAAKNYLTLVDAFTKFGQAILITGKTAIHVSNALVKYFSNFGIPINIVVDNGREFNNETVKEILNLHKIKIHFTTPLHHESNSICERFHSTLIEHLRILQETHPDDKQNIMEYALIGYNNSIHSATNFTPFELTFGHTSSRNANDLFLPKLFYSNYAEKHKDQLKHLYESVKEKLEFKKKIIVGKHNTLGDLNPEFSVGRIVYKVNANRNKKANKCVGPFKIVNVLDKNCVEIQSIMHPTKIETIHIKELKKPPKISDSPSSSTN